MKAKWRQADEHGELHKRHWRSQQKDVDFPWRHAIATIAVLAVVTVALVQVAGPRAIVDGVKRVHKYIT